MDSTRKNSTAADPHAAMISIELPDFPADERATIRKLCGEYKVSPAQFSIYATIPNVDAPMEARIVYVEHLLLKQKRKYPAGRKVNWLTSFAKDLKAGFEGRI